MGDAYDKGKTFEMKVAKMLRAKGDVGASRNKGSHANWNRRSDVFSNLPIHLECKAHETLKPREWYQQARSAASFNQTPIVTFPMDENVMALLELNAVLDLYAEISDLKLEVEDLRKPINNVQVSKPIIIKDLPTAKEAVKNMTEAITTTGGRVSRLTCRGGHIADDYGYCMQKDCKYRRGYKPPKAKKGGK